MNIRYQDSRLESDCCRKVERDFRKAS